jgi:hypothetical protein
MAPDGRARLHQTRRAWASMGGVWRAASVTPDPSRQVTPDPSRQVRRARAGFSCDPATIAALRQAPQRRRPNRVSRGPHADGSNVVAPPIHRVWLAGRWWFLIRLASIKLLAILGKATTSAKPIDDANH